MRRATVTLMLFASCSSRGPGEKRFPEQRPPDFAVDLSYADPGRELWSKGRLRVHIQGGTALIDDSGLRFTIAFPDAALDRLYAAARESRIGTRYENVLAEHITFRAGDDEADLEAPLQATIDDVRQTIETVIAQPDAGFPTERPSDFELDYSDHLEVRIRGANQTITWQAPDDWETRSAVLTDAQLDLVYATALPLSTHGKAEDIVGRQAIVTITAGGHRHHVEESPDHPQMAALRELIDKLARAP